MGTNGNQRWGAGTGVTGSHSVGPLRHTSSWDDQLGYGGIYCFFSYAVLYIIGEIFLLGYSWEIFSEVHYRVK